MENLVFRCTETGSDVQLRVSDLPSPADRRDSYEAVSCPACGRMHLVNRRTGRTLSDRTRR